MGSKERGKPERSTAGSTGGRNTGRNTGGRNTGKTLHLSLHVHCYLVYSISLRIKRRVITER